MPIRLHRAPAAGSTGRRAGDGELCEKVPPTRREFEAGRAGPLPALGVPSKSTDHACA